MKRFFLLCFISLLSHAEFIDQNTTTYSKVKSYCDNNQYKYCSEYKIEYLNFADDNFNEILKLLTEYIKKGYFFPYKEGNNCLYCEFYDICIIYETFEKTDEVFKNFQMLKEGKLFS